MAEFDGLTEFVKSGQNRLRDAEKLLDAPTEAKFEQGANTRHLRGAMYLAGYGVECLLKAYIISKRRGCTRLSEVVAGLQAEGKDVRDICGHAGHDLAYLLTLTGLEARMPLSRREQMSICAKWRSSWRYNPVSARREDAEALVQASRSIVEWIKTQI